MLILMKLYEPWLLVKNPLRLLTYKILITLLFFFNSSYKIVMTEAYSDKYFRHQIYNIWDCSNQLSE